MREACLAPVEDREIFIRENHGYHCPRCEKMFVFICETEYSIPTVKIVVLTVKFLEG